jgi:hypothetical protein
MVALVARVDQKDPISARYINFLHNQETNTLVAGVDQKILLSVNLQYS